MLIDDCDLVVRPQRTKEEKLSDVALGMLRAERKGGLMVTFILIDTFDDGETCWGWWVEKQRFCVIEPGCGKTDNWKTYTQGENPL